MHHIMLDMSTERPGGVFMLGALCVPRTFCTAPSTRKMDIVGKFQVLQTNINKGEICHPRQLGVLTFQRNQGATGSSASLKKKVHGMNEENCCLCEFIAQAAKV